MNRPPVHRPSNIPRSAAAVADALDLHSAIAKSLAANPVHEDTLRRAVWTYVGAERDAGASPGLVIMTLSELVERSALTPLAIQHAVTRSVILWCVEAYFGHLGGDVMGRDEAAFADAPVFPDERAALDEALVGER